MKEKIVGIMVCMLLFASALAVAAPTNKIVTSVTPVSSPCSGYRGTPSVSPLSQLSSLLGKTVYGCRENLDWDKELVSFTLDNPGAIHYITNSTSAYFLSGGCWVNSVWWACEESWFEGNNSKIWKINPTTGNMTVVGLSNTYDKYGLTGLTYDDKTNTMYACSCYNLYTINMFTGKGTKVGNFGMGGIMMIGIACDSAGNLYGESLGVPGRLYSINKTSGKASLIGNMGINLNECQDMAFDKDTDTLYLAAMVCDENYIPVQGALYYCDQHTAATTKIGDFDTYNLTDIDALAIPYTSHVNLSIQIKGGFGVKAIIKNTGTVNISGYPWQLQVKGGILGKINKTVNGTVSLKVGGSQTVTTGMLFGFGGLSITAQVAGFEETVKGTQLLIYTIVKK